MTMIVKIMHGDDLPDADPHKGFCLYHGVKSFHTNTRSDECGTIINQLILWIADDVKTAVVPGFSEHEKTVMVHGNVYIMNESGKTISTWTPRHRPINCGQSSGYKNAPDEELVRWANRA